MKFRVPFFLHDLGQPEIDAVAAVLAQPVLTTGEVVAGFEQRLADYLGTRHALALTSCTGGLHLSLLGLGIGPGDEVITTPMTFIATATSIIEAGARPVFVDVNPDTGNIDPAAVEAAITPRTRAIMPVHLYGQMCDMNALGAIAQRHGLAIIEDAAHCLEGVRDGHRPGSVGNTACFSFYATKNITCGEGGALATNDTALYEKLKLLRLHGMTSGGAERAKKGYRHWDMVAMGWKYNMSNIEAALLLPQMDRLASNLARREEIASFYDRELGVLPGVRAPTVRPHSVHARHLYPLRVHAMPRDDFIAGVQERGVGVVVNYRPVHLTSWFRDNFGFQGGAFPVAEAMGEATVSLPLYPLLGLERARVVVETVREVLAAG